MNKIIIPAGYMGSGSSAITDLVKEFRGYETFDDAFDGSFEYVFLHCPDGLFDLEDKLLVGNNALRSDEAIHRFEKCMENLYNQNFWWVGNYRKYLHPDFLKITQEYVKKIVQYELSNYWYMQQKYSFRDLPKLCLRKIMLLLSAGKIKLRLPLAWYPMKISLLNADEFYEISRQYLNKIFECMGLKERNLILDQLLLPHNLWRMEHYFGDNVECIVVERDPRDVFILNKYLWTKQDVGVAYPTNAETYCEYYRRLRTAEKHAENPHIHRVHFEDLVYHYEESVERIYRVLSLAEQDHIHKGKYFDPGSSIRNTQLFLNKQYRREIQIIEEQLPEYLYDFPYDQRSDLKGAF